MEVATIILAGGGLLLLAFAWLAWRRERQRRHAEERQWECSTIDVTSIAHRLEQVRSDYVATLHPLPVERFFQNQLLYDARRAVSRLAFFECRRSDPDDEHYDQ